MAPFLSDFAVKQVAHLLVFLINGFERSFVNFWQLFEKILSENKNIYEQSWAEIVVSYWGRGGGQNQDYCGADMFVFAYVFYSTPDPLQLLFSHF